MTDVFISYNRHDQVYARKLADDLRRHGLDVWIDDRIGHGDHWFDEIEQAISSSAAVVVIMTSEAEKSEWVKKEILIAKRERKPIYPVLLQGREFGLLIDLQFADVTGGRLPPDDFYARLAGSTLVAAQPPRPNRRGRMAGMAVATLAVVAVGVFSLASIGLIPRFWSSASPTVTPLPPTFPALDGTYLPPIDIGQIDPNAFPILSPVPFGGSLMPPIVEKGGSSVTALQGTTLVARYLSLVAGNQLDNADLYVCPTQQGNLTQSLRRLMTERNVADVVDVTCNVSGANSFSCDYTLVLTDDQRVPQTDTFYLENALIC